MTSDTKSHRMSGTLLRSRRLCSRDKCQHTNVHLFLFYAASSGFVARFPSSQMVLEVQSFLPFCTNVAQAPCNRPAEAQWMLKKDSSCICSH